MGLLWGTVEAGFVSSLAAYFGRIRDKILQSCKRPLPRIVKNIPIAKSLTYVFHTGVVLKLGDVSGRKDVALKT